MPWQEVSAMSLRHEFVTLASEAEANMRELCRRYRISSRTAYKWLFRFRADGVAGLVDRSRRPYHTPGRTPAAVEERVVALRREHPAWGGRKLHARLRALGLSTVPSPSTITAILRRHDMLDPTKSSLHRPWQRFEHAAPNDLWQMDFKGHIPTESGRCHPLTVLDDHSRFSLGLQACVDERGDTVRERLIPIFRRYGLPHRILVDNGPPWGDPGGRPYTRFTVWLLRLSIAVSHGRAFHPQTQGKDERFHRTLVAEVVAGRTFADLTACQSSFDHWRHVYNTERPHEALGLFPPVTRYAVSPRPYPETLPPLAYGTDDLVRKVQDHGVVQFHGRKVKLSKAFKGQSVALRPTPQDGVWQVFFHAHHITTIDERDYPK